MSARDLEHRYTARELADRLYRTESREEETRRRMTIAHDTLRKIARREYTEVGARQAAEAALRRMKETSG